MRGTTRRQPLLVFQEEERHALSPWDSVPYEITDWAHREGASRPSSRLQCTFYSVPETLRPPGQQVEIGLGSKLVRICHRGRLIKLHPRQERGGGSRDPADYPAELTAYTLRAPDRIIKRCGRARTGGG